jgi:CRISP-associated protein Cas1
MHEISQLNIMGNIQISTQAIQSLADSEIPVCYFSQGGWFYDITSGLSNKNVFLRKAQSVSPRSWSPAKFGISGPC